MRYCRECGVGYGWDPDQSDCPNCGHEWPDETEGRAEWAARALEIMGGDGVAEDLILLKAEEITRTEVVAVEGWLHADQVGAPDKARAILRTGLLAEHYRSFLSEDPEQITEAQSDKLKELLDEFGRALESIGGPPAPYP